MQYIKTQQNKITIGTVNAPLFVRNKGKCKDSKIGTVISEIKQFAQNNLTRLPQHINIEM